MRALTTPTSLAGIQVCVLVALLGALAGIAIAVATDVVSRTSVGGQNWSLSGNGALVVLFSGVPAVLAGGWGALARWRLRDGRWGTAGVSLGLVALLAAGLASFGPVIVVNTLGSGALQGESGALEAVAVSLVLPPLVAFVGGFGVATVMGAATRRGLVADGVVLGLVFVGAALFPGLFVPLGWVIAVPLLAALPVLCSRSRGKLFGWGWLMGACVCLMVGVIAGVIGAQQVQGL